MVRDADFFVAHAILSNGAKVSSCLAKPAHVDRFNAPGGVEGQGSPQLASMQEGGVDNCSCCPNLELDIKERGREKLARELGIRCASLSDPPGCVLRGAAGRCGQPAEVFVGTNNAERGGPNAKAAVRNNSLSKCLGAWASQGKEGFRFAGAKIQLEAVQGSNLGKRCGGKTNSFSDEARVSVHEGMHDVISVDDLSIISGSVKASRSCKEAGGAVGQLGPQRGLVDQGADLFGNAAEKEDEDQVRSGLASPCPSGSTDHCFGSVNDKPRVFIKAAHVFNKCRVGLSKLQKRAVCVNKVDGSGRYLCRKAQGEKGMPLTAPQGQ